MRAILLLRISQSKPKPKEIAGHGQGWWNGMNRWLKKAGRLAQPLRLAQGKLFAVSFRAQRGISFRN